MATAHDRKNGCAMQRCAFAHYGGDEHLVRRVTPVLRLCQGATRLHEARPRGSLVDHAKTVHRTQES